MDSNHRLSGYEPDALTAELTARILSKMREAPDHYSQVPLPLCMLFCIPLLYSIAYVSNPFHYMGLACILSRLYCKTSHTMDKLRGQDSNLRPPVYEAGKLPLLYRAMLLNVLSQFSWIIIFPRHWNGRT